jgi:hypothetical protein
MTDAITARPQPQTDVTRRVDVLEGVTFADLVSMGDQLARTGFLPEHIKNGPQFAAIVMTGKEMGMPPMRAIRSFYLVKGKVMEDASSQLARFKNNGGRATFDVLDETRAVLTLTHPNGDKHTETWTLEDAKKAGLLNGMVGKFPKAMLRSRVITAGLKSLGWEGAVGTYDPSELVDTVEDAPQVQPVRTVEVLPPAKPVGPPAEIKRVLDLADLIINATDTEELSYGFSKIADAVAEVADQTKAERYQLALDGLVERRAAEMRGVDWDSTTDKAEASQKLAQHVAKMKAAR